jgi:putative oxidoreductase
LNAEKCEKLQFPLGLVEPCVRHQCGKTIVDNQGSRMNLEFRLSKYQPQVLSILRIIAGLLFLSAGLQKWFGFPVANPAYANIQLISWFGIAGIIEIVGGTLVTLGLFTRAAAFIMSAEMAVAYWYFANRPARGLMPIANGGTLEVLYCFVFFYLVFAGAGAWSLDAMLRKKA